MSLQNDLPDNSLLFFHARHDDDQSHGGFNSVEITNNSMLIKFYTAKGLLVLFMYDGLSIEAITCTMNMRPAAY